MRRPFRNLVASFVILLVAACGEQSPTRPTVEPDALTARGPATQAALEAQINGLVNALYAPKEQGAVKVDFARIKAQLASGRTEEAEAGIVSFVQTLLEDLAGGDLEDPNGAQPPTTADALASLVNAVAQFGGLPPPIPPSNPLGGDGAVAVLGPAGGTVVASSGFGGVQFPPGALPENTIVVVNRLPNPTTPTAGPLPTPLDQYPLFYDFSTTPHVAQFAQPVLVGICQLEVGQPFGPPTQTVANRLQIAHPDPANPSTLELLAREVAPFVDCSGVQLSQARLRRQGEGLLVRALGSIRDVGARAVSVFRPTPAYAVHGGLGGKTTSFSPFGAVDPGAGSCPPSAPSGFATVSCFSFTTIPGTWHGFVVGNSIPPVPPALVGQLSAEYVLLSPTGLTRIPANTPPDVNQAQYTFESEFNGTNHLDVLRIVTPATQPAQQILVNVVKPVVVGVCATPMTGVAQTYPTVDAALTSVAPGGVVKICPHSILVPAPYLVTKPLTIEAENPAIPPMFTLSGSVLNGFVVTGGPNLTVFRNLSFTLTNNGSAIDVGTGPWNDVLVENNVFSLPSGSGRAVRVFSSSLPNPKITIQGNQMSGGIFPIVTLTGSATGTIEVLSNAFSGVVSTAGAQIQSENNVLVEGNTFSSGGCGGNGCIFLLNVANGLVRNNTMNVSGPRPIGIRFSLSSGTITQNSITGIGGGGSPSLESSYAMSIGGIVITPNAPTDLAALSSSTVSVTQNTVTNAAAGILVRGGGSTVSGSNNVFTTVHSALRLDNTSATPSSLSVTTSDFTSYFSPILFLGASPAPNTINATCNWWGNVLGPQNLLAGTPVVSYSPWSTAPVANGAGGLCNGT